MPPAKNINPFVVGGAIASSDGRGFYGREDIFQFVSDALNRLQRAPILLIGQRRIGKSSVLKQLQRNLGPDYKCIFYDLQGRAELTLDETLYGLGRAIADGLAIPRPEEQQVTAETFPDFLSEACAAVDNHPERLVLLFDEFDVVDQTFAGRDIAAKRFIPYLGELVSQFPTIGYILVVGRRSEELSDGFFSAILRQTVQMRIGRLDREQTQRLVTDSFGTRVSQLAMDEVFSLTAGHPFCVQILCSTIWNSFPATTAIGVSEVDSAIQTAIQQWTNGLNWNYDGFEDSSQRLFLSALASLSGKNAMWTASLTAIQEALFERRVGVDPSKLQLTPHDLLNWDVISGDSQGYRFTVPLIGAWVQMARPLQDFEGETRLINPRAARYYDLALDSQQRGQFDDAIRNFSNALEENSVFIEAQLGLAASLRARQGPGDPEAAIEAYERLLELDPATSPTTLLDLLIKSVETNSVNANLARRRYKRILELEPSGRYRDRATRLLQHMAELRFSVGSNRWLLQAAELWKATGNKEEEASVYPVLEQIAKVQRISGFLWGISALLWVLGFLLLRQFLFATPYVRQAEVALAAMAGQGMSIGVATERDGRLSFRRMGWVGWGVALVIGLVAIRYFHNNFWIGVMVFFSAAIVNVAINPSPSLPPELSTQPQSAGAGFLRSSFSDWMIRTGTRLAPNLTKTNVQNKSEIQKSDDRSRA